MKKLLFITIIFLLFLSCKTENNHFEANYNSINISVNKETNIVITIDSIIDKSIKIPIKTAFLTLEDGQIINDFELVHTSKKIINDSIGEALAIYISGESKSFDIEKNVVLKVYNRFKDFIVIDQNFKNTGNDTLFIKEWSANQTKIEAVPNKEFWSFNGSSSEERNDWILPVDKGFYKENYLGMNDSDYGGGIPLSAVWRNDYGIALGHLSLTPELVSIPIEFKKELDYSSLGLSKELLEEVSLSPSENFDILETFISVYHGDCFEPLSSFSTYMKAKGLKFVPSEKTAFEPVWCAWGYERNFTVDEVINTLPKVKELGFKWAVVDDGFQIDEGNWNLDPKKFPKGNQEMKELVDKIHSYGLKAKIWWTPLAVDMLSDVLKENPDMILRNENESPQYITWWDAFYMSPGNSKTIQLTKEAIDLFINKWGFDGFKMDGQHMNAIPPDYNKELKNPEQQVRDLPKFFQMIYDEVTAVKKDAVIENCPCGTCMSFYNMTSTNQTVSSDPESSWQIRTKGKVYKALIPKTAYYGDHVELSDNQNDFASSFGIGAVLGSKFTWPADNPTAEGSYLLTPEKEKSFKKWIGLYEQKRLSQADYLGNLYDIGFDKPETHVIKKLDTLFYAFYDKHWKGTIELRGLDKTKKYVITDYENNKELETIDGRNPVIDAEFKDHLLIEVYPID